MSAPRYDKYGRLQFNSEIHTKQGDPWTNHDEKYLIENYEKDGPEAISMVLERTIHTIMQRAYALRKAGKMPKRTTEVRHERVKPQRWGNPKNKQNRFGNII